MEAAKKTPSTRPAASVDERLTRAARHVSSQLNASVALEMVRDLTRLLRERPNQNEAHYFLGVAYDCLANRKVGSVWWRRRKAQQHYRAAIERLPESSPFATFSTLGMAANLAWVGRYQEARRILSKLLISSDAVLKMRSEIILGVAAFRSRRWDAAMQHWRTADTLAPDDLTSHTSGLPGSWLQWGYRELAERHLRHRRFEKAYDYSSQLVSLDGMFLTPQDYRLHATICEKVKKRQEALESLDTALALAVDDGAERAATYAGDRPSFMPSWGYAYDRLVDGSGAFESDLEK